MLDGCLQALKQLDDTSLKAAFNQFADIEQQAKISAGAHYSTFRLVPVTLRTAYDCCQVTAFRFFDIQVHKIARVSANNPGGNNPGTETPSYPVYARRVNSLVLVCSLS